MVCENPNCKSKIMQNDFIKIIKPGERTIYYCSQECFNEIHNPKRKFVFGRQPVTSFADWSKINMSGW